MGKIEDFNISKDDVPYLSRNWALWIQIALSVSIFATGWLKLPLYFPGFIEALVGFLIGLPVGLLYARVALVQVRAASARSKGEAGPAFLPFCPEVGKTEYITAAAAAFLAYSLLIGVIYQIYLIYNGLTMPWAHFSVTDQVSDHPFPYTSVISASTVCFFTNLIVTQGRLLSWYKGLVVQN